MSELIENLLARPGPKKILSCDGGGILGLMSVEVLLKLETDLRARLGRPQLRLGEYFDFVCGTSTGAIIAACISAGMEMDAIRAFYVNSGEDMFDKAALLRRLHYKFDDEPLARKLREELNAALGRERKAPPATLGDAGLKTLLMMVLRNHSTDSPWPVSNNPRAKYNQRNRDDCNLDLPLWQLVRASTAAPTFFPPEIVTFAKGKGRDKEYQFVFVDGGVTTYNNPAFLAFQMATAEPYRIGWATGVDQLLIVSVGTGSTAATQEDIKERSMHLLHHATTVPGALMNAAMAGWDMACRTLGDCRHGRAVDSEFGDMVGGRSSGPKQFAYVRYDPDVSRAGLDALGLQHIDAKQVQLMDSVEHIARIQEVGRVYAARTVDIDHLRGFV